MFAILSAATGIGMYIGAVRHAWTPLLATGLSLLAITLLCFALGGIIGASHPAAARWLMTLWNVSLVLIAGAIAALVIYGGVLVTVGDDASGQTKAIYGAVGAVITAVAASVNGWLSKLSFTRAASAVINRRYSELFPCVPVGQNAGRAAREAMEPVLDGQTLTDGAAVQGVLKKIRSALAAGEYAGGTDWTCL